jgi:hypothetical protein
MQYSCTLDRAGIAAMADRFVEAVASADREAALECLHDTAYFCVQTHFAAASGRQAIAAVLDRYREKVGSIEVTEAQSIVDAKNGRVAIACSMRPRGGEAQGNTLFFRFRDDRIQDVFLYLSGENFLG